MSTLAVGSGNFDISSEAQILEYTNEVGIPLATVALAEIGSDDNPVIGGGIYHIRVYYNGLLLLPDSAVSVGALVNKFATQSRNIVMNPGDVLAFKIVGLPSDENVAVRLRLVEEPIFEAIDNLEVVVDTGPIVDAVESAINGMTIRPQKVKLGVCRSYAGQSVSICRDGPTVKIHKK